MTRNTRPYSVNGRRGFTLVELLVVIGIIVLLVSIVTPMVMNSRRSAARIRTQADLNTVAMGLEQYKKDFGDYPRPDPASPTTPLLAWALVGPWQAVETGSDPADGADGFGFRTQWDKNKNVGGRVFGPYIAPEKFKIEKVAGTPTVAYLQDQYGSRIEYLPLWRKYKPNMALFGVPGGNPMSGGISTNNPPSVYDCRQASAPEVVYYLQRGLGDTNHNDQIDTGTEQAAANEYPPFLLMTHTKDFSSQKEMDESFSKVTEVSNFPQP